jgi:hypothetical protein
MKFEFCSTAIGYWTRTRTIEAESLDEARRKLDHDDETVEYEDDLESAECTSEQLTAICADGKTHFIGHEGNVVATIP